MRRRTVEFSVWYQNVPISGKRVLWYLVADAAAAAFSYTNARRFEGLEPIYFGFRWYLRRPFRPEGAAQYAYDEPKIWPRLADSIANKGFICDPKVRLLPDRAEVIFAAEVNRLVLKFRRE